eukprot:3290071-Ditylum_brightwellii.AAC.1
MKSYIYQKKVKESNTCKNLLHRIAHLYSYQDQMLQADHFLFERDLKAWKTKTSIAIKTWLNANQPFIAKCLATQKQQEKKKLKDIRKCFKITHHRKWSSNPRNKQKELQRRKIQHNPSTSITKFLKVFTTCRKRQPSQILVETTSLTGNHQEHKKSATQVTSYYTSQGRPPDRIQIQ